MTGESMALADKTSLDVDRWLHDCSKVIIELSIMAAAGIQ